MNFARVRQRNTVASCHPNFREPSLWSLSGCRIFIQVAAASPQRARGGRGLECGVRAAEHLHVAEDCLLFLYARPPASSSSITSPIARKRRRTMSSALPKSESATSLLRSYRRSGDANNDRRSRRSRHHPPGAGGGDDAGWTEDCEPSARRPLCQPRHADSRNQGDRREQKSHSHRQDYAEEDARHSRHQKERGKSTRSKHHQQDSPRGEPPPAAHQQGSSRQGRRTSPTPSYSKQADEAAFFFEPSERAISRSSSSLSSDPPGASAPVQPASAGRASKRLSATASEYDSSLHPIVKSVFGQVRGHEEQNNTREAEN